MSNRIYNTKTATHMNALMSSVTAFICPRLQLHPEAVGGTAAAHNKAAEKIREVRGGSIWTLKTSRRGHTHTHTPRRTKAPVPSPLHYRLPPTSSFLSSTPSVVTPLCCWVLRLTPPSSEVSLPASPHKL